MFGVSIMLSTGEDRWKVLVLLMMCLDLLLVFFK